MKIGTTRLIFDITVWTTSLCLALGVLAHGAIAESKVFPVIHEKWKAECGSCHVAYPAQLLDATSWRSLMSRLDRHFGSDASLDEPVRRDIQGYLERMAARSGRGSSAKDGRISSTSWFRHEHDEVPSGAWRHDKVKSAANCGACHTGAETGDYSERNLRMPRGLSRLED
jgi:nitrate/TMAO reductase-like tetraheme cytochrome c subunit